MAITTEAGVRAGMRPLEPFTKIGTNAVAPGSNSYLYQSTFYQAGHPEAAALCVAGVNGEVLTAPVVGQLPYTNPASGNSYLSRLAITAETYCTVLLCDRLWQNECADDGGNPFTIASPTWPARDKIGGTDGVGLLCGFEFPIAQANEGTHTLEYTNSAGTPGRTSVVTLTTGTQNAGTFYSFPLDTGDVGIQSVEGMTPTNTGSVGQLVIYRVLASLPCIANIESVGDHVSLGFPQLHNGSVPFILRQQAGALLTAATDLSGTFGLTEG